MARHTGRSKRTLLVAGLILTGFFLWSWISLAENSTGPAEAQEKILRIDPAYADLTEPLPPGATTGPPAVTPPATLPDKVIDLADSEERVSVLVWFNPGLSFQAVERSDVKQLAADRGAFTRYEYKTVLPDVINLRNVPVSMLDDLKARPGVVKVEQDVYHPDLVRLDESTPHVRALQSQLTAAGLPYDGSGVRVCVADTGIDMDHTMYASRIDTAASWDFVNNDSNPDDDHGHGSHVSGIAVGRTGLTVDFGCEGVEPFQGVAPGATLIGAKILNSFGGGTDSDIIAGIDHCADQTASGGRADVINLSIGTGNYSSGACTHSWAVASNNAVANGVVVVAASGNENNSNSMGSPACGADVIAVGATYKDSYPNCEDSTSSFNWSSCVDNSPNLDDIVCFSNQSDFLDVSAPGAVIQSASNATGGASITGKSGTSMASPMVAGLAALVLDADPTLTPAEVRQAIRAGATDLGPAGFDRAYGYGRIDAINTLNQLAPCGIDADCDDGQWCNGAETCNAGSCDPGTPQCAGGICDEATDTCSVLAYEWTMDSNPGWTVAGQWAWGQPTGGGGEHGGPDPTGGATGANVIGYNLSGDYTNNLAETHLTTTAIDCSGLTNVTLRFQRWLGVEQPSYDHAYLRVSNNGTTWTTIWENTAEVADAAWSQLEYDISAVADNQSTVYIRWTMGTTDSSWLYCGWNIDDVQIFASGGGGPTCSDGILNQGETRIDCGGPCPACACTSDGACDDGLFCNGTETCDSFGNCQAGSTVNCDDGLYCNGAETCDDASGCQPGTAVDCNDGVGCTGDSCNEGTDSCDNAPDDATCDDGLFCNGAEICDVVNDCQAGGDPCPGQNCDETGNVCVQCTIDSQCNDGLYCNGVETCAAGSCQAGAPVVGSDGVDCTTDTCNEGTNSCDFVPADAACDDGQWCNGAETCDALADCQPGTAVNCDDGVGCTGDSCNEGTDSCDNTPDDAACDDGQFCNGAETCDAVNDCQAGGDPCPGQSCDETGNVCVQCTIDSECDDGLYCNGAETCAAGSCQAGAPVVCSDGVGCTTDTCNEGTNSCDFVPADAACDDGQWCNGAETCDALADCQPGVTVNCDDGVGCTGDSCNEGTDSCDNTPDDAACNDGQFCNGAETCDAINDCQAGGDPCVGLFCDETGDVCLQCLVDGDCDDGLFCNGAETCSGGTCQGGGDPCPGQTCNEGTDTCESTTAAARIESGTVSAAGTPVTVSLTNSYVSPVVVCSVQYNSNTTPVVARVSNVSGTSFDVRLQNPGGGAVLADNVSYVVVEAGTWNIDGVAIEAQTYLSTVTDEDGSWVGEAQTYGQSYTSPVVLGQVMTENDPAWSAFWSHGGTRSNPPTAAALYTGKMVAEDTNVTRADETVGFIVFEAGHGTIGGVEFEALLGADGVAGVDNAPPYSYTFSTAFASPPAVNLALLSAMDGVNGGWGQTHGPTAATNTTLYVSIDEDTIGDGERSHTGEQVAYVVFESAFAYEPAPECAIDPDCDDGQFCNGPEICFAGSCMAGAPITCDDGVGCTVDTCDEAGDTCNNVPSDSVCDDGLFCNGTETCDAVNDCQAGSDPCAGGPCDEANNVCDTPSAAQLESVNVLVGGTAATVALTNTYTSPVVVCSAQYDNNTVPIVTRVSNVTGTSFDVRLQNPSGGAVVAENVTCLVVEQGVWTIDGVAVEAQTYLSTVTDENNSWVGEAQSYGQSYTSPVVLGQVMTENDANWSVFWCQGSARTNPPSATALRTGKEVAEDTLITRADETVGFIVIEAGHGTLAGVEYEAALGADTVRGPDNSPPFTYNFGTAFPAAPSVVLTTLAGIDGGNGGWAQQHGATYSTASSIYLSVDEDTIGDSERIHTTEQVGYVVFETPVVFP